MDERTASRRDQEILNVLMMVERGELDPAAADRMLAALAGQDTAPNPPESTAAPRHESSGAHASEGRSSPTTGRGELPLEVRRLEREARRLAHEARRLAERDLKGSMREAKSEIKRAFRLSVAESKRALSQVESELRGLFGDAESVSPGNQSWLAKLAGLDFMRDRVSHTTRVELSQELGDAESIAIRNASGDVTIRGWDEPRVVVHGNKTGWGIDRDIAQDRADSMPLEVGRRDGEILVEARAPVPAGVGLLNLQRMRTNLVVMVPRELPVLVAAKGGDVAISGHPGAVEVTTTSGDVVVSGSRASVDVETTSGDVRLEGCRTPVATLTSLSGDISVDLRPEAQGEYRLRSANGDIVVELSGDVDTEVIAETDTGDLLHGRALRASRREPGRLCLRYPDPGDREVGQAAATMRIVTIRGDISVS